MKGLALIVGAGGIGTQIAKDLSECEKDLDVVLCGRKSEFNSFWQLDIEDSQSLLQLKNKISNHPSKLRLVVNATGRLHSDSLQPEKRLQHLDKKNMIESFSINAFSPILLAKNIEEFIPKDFDFNFASISARVGSIGDNQTAWGYSYRAAKAAQKQFFKCKRDSESSISNSQKELNSLFLPHKTTSKSFSLSFRSLASCVPIPPAPTTKAKPFILLKIT